MSINSKMDLLYEAAVKSWGAIAGILGFLGVVLALFVVDKKDQIGTRWVVSGSIFLCLVLIVLSRAFIDASNKAILTAPRISIVLKPSGAFAAMHALLLIESNPIYYYDSMVSIYFLENGMEQLIGIGKVVNIQNDMRIQIGVLSDINFGDRWKHLFEGRAEDLSKVVIKPSIPNFVMEGFFNGQ